MTTTGADFIAASLALSVAGINGTIASWAEWHPAVTRLAATIHPQNRTSIKRVIPTIGRSAFQESADLMRRADLDKKWGLGKMTVGGIGPPDEVHKRRISMIDEH